MVARTLDVSSQTVDQSPDRRQPGLLSLYLMEWFKIPRRRMTQIIFFLMAGGIAFTPFAGYLTRSRSMEGAYITENYLLPEALTEMFSTMSTFGIVLAAVLAAGLAGSEYGWGTIRTLVGSGAPRWKLLAAKFMALATTIALLVIVGLAAGIVMSMAIGVLDGHGLFGWLSGDLALDLPVMIGRAIFLQLVLATLAFSVAQITRSTAAGIATGIGVIIVDPIIALLFSKFGDIGETLNRLLISPNIAVIDRLNSSNPPVVVDTEVFGPWAAAGLLALYAVILAAAAFAVFIRRDIITV